MIDLTIGTLARNAGVGVETVRFYQRRGLLAVPPRAGGFRRYDDRDVERLKFIKRAQAAGFTLAEIGELIALDAGEDRPRARALAAARIKALDAKIAELKDARAALSRLARECGEDRAGPCPIIASFG
ncbi:MerR family transcriptional regulator [Sphingomonas sp. NSE70-1]|uniref:MerR family transcriptional regulator n=1 Tax=Sphingomonas caseinilyticus TaxID=2908205 RepID=A0ABT0RT21_9SPHN|nr:MerR family transcriptional regulator [Sphingomonas caseinilyticus]MCL6698076.1 MerR family transcriptional regulator [Sphingomonas caseinilyticus]